VVATFRQPFDLLVETTAIAARHGAGNTAKSAKSKIWLTSQSVANQSPGGFYGRRLCKKCRCVIGGWLAGRRFPIVGFRRTC
jgi:hypothetical protein